MDRFVIALVKTAKVKIVTDLPRSGIQKIGPTNSHMTAAKITKGKIMI